MVREFARLLKRGSGIAAVAALAAFAGKASALAYVGNYDPPFQSNFTGGFWSGQVTIDVPEACIPSAAGEIVVVGGNNIGQCSGLKLLSATVNLKQNGTLIDTLHFPEGGISTLTRVRFFDGVPTGINGAFTAPVESDLFIADDGEIPTTFLLKFQSYIPVLRYIYYSNIEEDYVDVTTPLSGDYAAKWKGPFQVVSEPASLALLIPALGALVLIRRRRDRTCATTLA